MKKIYFLTMALCAFAFTANAQFFIEDDAEAYALGDMGTQNPTVWSVWSGAPNSAEDINVVDDQANSGSQSFYVDDSGVTDVLLLLGNRTDGDYTLAFKMYIPATKTGYFNVQGETESGGAGNGGAGVFNSGNITFNEGGATPGEVVDAANGDILNYPESTWFDVSLYFDVDNGEYTMTVNGASATTTPFQEDAVLGGLDFFSIDTNNQYYIDDVIFAPGVLGTNDFAADVFSVYPNPVKDVLNINSKVSVDAVTVYDVLGKVVLQAQPDAVSPSIDMSALSSGAYLVNVKIGNAAKTIKVIK